MVITGDVGLQTSREGTWAMMVVMFCDIVVVVTATGVQRTRVMVVFECRKRPVSFIIV